MSIAISFATSDDVLALLTLGKEYYEEYALPEVKFDSDTVVKSMNNAIQGKNNSVLLISKDTETDKITGYLYGALGGHFYSKDLGCTLHSMYVSPTYRGGMSAVKLMHAFKRWGHQHNVKAMYFSIASNIRTEETHRFLKKMGFTLTGGNYVLVP